jgi:hypothetical protein
MVAGWPSRPTVPRNRTSSARDGPASRLPSVVIAEWREVPTRPGPGEKGTWETRSRESEGGNQGADGDVARTHCTARNQESVA